MDEKPPILNPDMCIGSDGRIILDDWMHANRELSLEFHLMADDGVLSFRELTGLDTTPEQMTFVSNLLMEHLEARKQDDQEKMKRTAKDLDKMLNEIAKESFDNKLSKRGII